MSEYWKSTPRYWCKHCKTYIRDTASEKTQHEATGKHQGNLKRFLRDIHRNKEREERENQKAKDEVQRLNGIVSGSGLDTQGAGVGGSAPWRRGGQAAPAAPQPATASERKRQVAQLAEMGVAVPQEFRGEMALAGEWETVSERRLDGNNSGINIGVRKRKHEGGDGEEEEGEEGSEKVVKKNWGSTTRNYPGFQEEDDDLDALLQSTTVINGKKARQAVKTEPGASDATVKAEKSEATEEKELPGVKKEDPEPGVGGWVAGDTSSTADAAIKTEDPGETNVPSEVAKEPPEGQAAGIVFKKRKPKHTKK